MKLLRTLPFVIACTLSCFACDNKNADSTAAASASALTSAAPTTSAVMPTTVASGAPTAVPVGSASLAAQADSIQSAMLAAASAGPSTGSLGKLSVVQANANAPAAPPSASAAPACGSKANPCPLQAWMQQNANPAVASGDAAQIGTALDQIAKFAPAGYSNWAKIASDGSAAAKSGDVPAAKGACRSCHDQYKAKYKSEMRDRKI